jgi:hypothetical protein
MSVNKPVDHKTASICSRTARTYVPLPQGARVVDGRLVIRSHAGASPAACVISNNSAADKNSASDLWELGLEDLLILWGMVARLRSDADEIMAFFNLPHRAFEGRSPIAVAASSREGLQSVSSMLNRMIVGTRMRRSLLGGLQRALRPMGRA